MNNPFTHIQLHTGDVGASRKFYQSLFRWKFDALKDIPYTMISTGSKETDGGLQQKPDAGSPAMWLTYVEVKSVKATLAKAVKHGATIAQAYTGIPGMGAFGVFVDPDGAPLGVWEAGKPVKKKARASRR